MPAFLLPILLRAWPYLAGVAAVAVVALWLRHSGAEAERASQAARDAATITHAEEARRAADANAAVAADPADRLRRGGYLRD